MTTSHLWHGSTDRSAVGSTGPALLLGETTERAPQAAARNAQVAR